MPDPADTYRRHLEEIAHCAWHALDDSEERPDGDVVISSFDYMKLQHALNALTGPDGDIHKKLNVHHEVF